MTSTRLRSAVAGTVLLGLLAACAGAGAFPGAPDAPLSEHADAAVASAVTGSWGTPDRPATPSLELTEDGTAAGTDGCNRVVGSWDVESEVVSLNGWAATRMWCEGVDDWLSRASSATLQDERLVFLDADGQELGRLAPTSAA